MIGYSKRVHVLVGGAIGLNLLLGAAAAAGVVPRPVATQNAASVRVAGSEVDAVPVNPQPQDTELAATTNTPPAPPETTVAPAPSTTAAPKATTTTEAPAPAVTEATRAPAATPAVLPVPAPAINTRANPTSAQVMAAVQQMRQRIPLLPANEAYARQFGDAVCSAFDQGNSAAEVRTMVVNAAGQLIKITAADADFAIRTAVQLFCPGYLSKLG